MITHRSRVRTTMGLAVARWLMGGRHRRHLARRRTARTAWHTHPRGQTLIVTSGLGRVQRVGSVIEDIAPGDVVWIEPGEKHWHGASPMTAMTHIAIAEMLDGTAVQWMDKVTDEQYGADGSVREE